MGEISLVVVVLTVLTFLCSESIKRWDGGGHLASLLIWAAGVAIASGTGVWLGRLGKSRRK